MADFSSMPSAEIVGVIVYDSAGPSRDDIVARIEWIAQHGMAIPELLRREDEGSLDPPDEGGADRLPTAQQMLPERALVGHGTHKQDRPAHPHRG